MRYRRRAGGYRARRQTSERLIRGAGRRWPAAAALVAVALVAAAGGSCRDPGQRRVEATAPSPATAPSVSAVDEGKLRPFTLHVPDGLSGPMPLVLVFHGGGGNGERAARQTGMNRVADHHGFAVAYPNADRYWNDGRAATSTGPDDVQYVRALIDHLVDRIGADPDRVYATGASNGGMFTLRLACEAPDAIAAFVPVIASFPADYRCTASRPVPIMMINGDKDRLIQWSGGEIMSGFGRGAGGRVVPVPETVEFWRQNNGCSTSASEELLPDTDRDDGTRVRAYDYQGCPPGAPVRLVKIEGGGHTWAGGPAPRLGARLVGRVSRDIDAGEATWNFVSRFRRR